MSKKHRIAIIFIDEIHHVNHFAMMAVELAKKNDVSIITYPEVPPYLFNTMKRLKGDDVKIVKRSTQVFRALTDRLKNRSLPRKGFWMKKNQNYLLSNFDAILFSDYTQYKLLKYRGNKKFPKFVFFSHGPPGRSYSYKKDQKNFDLQLLISNFHYEQLKKRELLAPAYKVIGSPKLDAVPSVKNASFFKNNKPIVLYNPHFSPPTSSWHNMGLEILDYFYTQNKYNLIFAPHINLFNKIGGDDKRILHQKHFNCKHIHMDLGSHESVDMTYVNVADIYLGDVSSQVYEFLLTPRPCIFLNAENIAHEGKITYRFWQCGPVIETVAQLPKTLIKSKESLKNYTLIQKKITDENYYTEAGSTASERAATAVLDFLNKS